LDDTATMIFLRFKRISGQNLSISISINLGKSTSINMTRITSLILFLQIYEPTNPKGAETLPPGIIVSESDFHQHRLWGNPYEVYAKWKFVLLLEWCHVMLLILVIISFIFNFDEQDLPLKPKYLAVFTVGYQQKELVNAAVQKVLKY
jgi:hypothetical protein